MTQEEKAKAYDEALERAKELLLGNEHSNTIRSYFEHIFPELRESEDERIIRSIIDALYSHTNSINLLSSRGYQMGNIEAWLEKQKYDRMKPVYDNQDSFESALEKAWKDYNDSGARTVDGCEDNYVECAHAKGFREGYLFGLEKQKESLHIPETCKENADSFTDEDEKIRKQLLDFLEHLHSLGKGIDFDVWSKADCANWIVWLEKQKEQKPVSRNFDMTPDKIYVLPEVASTVKVLDEELEYIRKEALLEWARNMYEKTMTFVSGDSERDNEIQKFALRIVKHIESL